MNNSLFISNHADSDVGGVTTFHFIFNNQNHKNDKKAVEAFKDNKNLSKSFIEYTFTTKIV